LTCTGKLTGDQLYIPHVITNEKYKGQTKKAQLSPTNPRHALASVTRFT